MEHFVVTIARGYGSGGHTIGKLLARELGVNYYDRELLRMASDNSGINEELFGKADEQVNIGILKRIMRKVYPGEKVEADNDDVLSNDNLFNYQAEVIRQLAKEESCIIIGRCADYILKDEKDVVKVFVHAPLEHCVDIKLKSESGSRKEIEKEIIRKDKNRKEYYQYHTKREWDNARNYDLCINTNELLFKEGAALIKAYLEIRNS